MDEFSRQVRARIRLHYALKEAKPPEKAYCGLSDATVHSVGQSGCYCRECLVFRKHEWRIGDLNPTVVGPRDEWLMYCWGDGERGPLCSRETHPIAGPFLVPPIMETTTIQDSSKRRWTIERDAKFTAVASGKYHTLLLAESQQLFACGDNSYLNMSTPVEPGSDPCDNYTTTPTSMMDSFRGLGQSRIMSIACTDYASFALVDKPVDDDDENESVFRQRRNELELKAAKKRPKDTEPKEVNEFNHVYSWGRGDRGVLGHGSTESHLVPRIIHALNYFRVTQLAAGRQHVLALTESHGVFSFGNGSRGQLGLGTTSDSLVPARIDTFDGINVTFVAAGDDFSGALTDTVGSRQVFMWGCGQHGKLGNGNQDDKLKPTRVQALRGTKIRGLSCGGSHTLVVAEPAGAKVKGTTVVLSWGHGLYGQLGHRDNWDALTPKVIDEIASERIEFVSGGARHSLALSESGVVWAWGHGIHGHQPNANLAKDLTSSALLFPRKVYLPNIHVIGGLAGRGRTFVWGDRATTNPREHRQVSAAGTDTLSDESRCSMSSATSVLSSNSLRVLYSCGTCHLPTVCVVCSARCHGGHCLTLRWTLENCLSRECHCQSTGKCVAMGPDEGDAPAND